jgi:hypothetical protein
MDDYNENYNNNEIFLAEELKLKTPVYFGGLCFPLSSSAFTTLWKVKLSLFLIN